MPNDSIMTDATSQAEALLPCGLTTRFGKLKHICTSDDHDIDCAAIYRPAVAIALQANQIALRERDERIERLRTEIEAIQSEITEAAYRAWPESEDCGYDAGHIIDQLAAERDDALKPRLWTPTLGGKPEFGDGAVNPWASTDNPTRMGIFVREFRRTGRLNPGTIWEFTDGNGKFWEINKKAFFEDRSALAHTGEIS